MLISVRDISHSTNIFVYLAYIPFPVSPSPPPFYAKGLPLLWFNIPIQPQKSTRDVTLTWSSPPARRRRRRIRGYRGQSSVWFLSRPPLLVARNVRFPDPPLPTKAREGRGEGSLISDRLEREKMGPKECFLDSNLLMMPPSQPASWGATTHTHLSRPDIGRGSISQSAVQQHIQRERRERWAVLPFRDCVCVSLVECAGFVGDKKARLMWVRERSNGTFSLNQDIEDCRKWSEGFSSWCRNLWRW